MKFGVSVMLGIVGSMLPGCVTPSVHRHCNSEGLQFSDLVPAEPLSGSAEGVLPGPGRQYRNPKKKNLYIAARSRHVVP